MTSQAHLREGEYTTTRVNYLIKMILLRESDRSREGGVWGASVEGETNKQVEKQGQALLNAKWTDKQQQWWDR